jgi:16S rRNA processing protein RimM
MSAPPRKSDRVRPDLARELEEPAQELIRQVGRLGKAHGTKGAVILHPESDFLPWLSRRKHLLLCSGRQWFSWPVCATRRQGEALLLHLQEIEDRTHAESLAGWTVHVWESEAREALDPDTYYHSDLVGLEVYENEKHLGKVRSVLEMPAHPLLEVQRPEGNTFLVPFTRIHVPELDLEQKRLRVALPEGLLDL